MSEAAHVDANPGVRRFDAASKPSVSPDSPTLRLIQGRYTVDLLPTLVDGRNIPVFVSTGELGTPPTTLVVPIGLASQLVEVATVVRERRVIDTAGWSSPAVELTPHSEKGET